MRSLWRVDRRQWLHLLRLSRSLDRLGRLIGVDIWDLLLLCQTVNSSAITLNFCPTLPTTLLGCHVLVRSHIWISKAKSLLLVTLDFDFIVAIDLNPLCPPDVPGHNFSDLAIISLTALPVKSSESWSCGWLDYQRGAFDELLPIIFDLDHVLGPLLHVLFIATVLVLNLVPNFVYYLLAILRRQGNQLTRRFLRN